MKIIQNNDELVLKETPGCLWVFGLFFAVIGGVFVFGALGGASNRDAVSPTSAGIAFFMGAVAVGAGIWVIYRAPVTKIVLNRTMKKIDYTRLGLGGKQAEIYNFADIRQFCLVEEFDDEGDPIWSLGMELASGETLKISSLQSHDEKYKRDFVFQINEFLGKQMPSYQTNLEIES